MSVTSCHVRLPKSLQWSSGVCAKRRQDAAQSRQMTLGILVCRSAPLSLRDTSPTGGDHVFQGVFGKNDGKDASKQARQDAEGERSQRGTMPRIKGVHTAAAERRALCGVALKRPFSGMEKATVFSFFKCAFKRMRIKGKFYGFLCAARCGYRTASLRYTIGFSSGRQLSVRSALNARYPTL